MGRDLVANLIERHSRIHQLLNVDKTKEAVVDFRRRGTVTDPIIMTDEPVGPLSLRVLGFPFERQTGLEDQH